MKSRLEEAVSRRQRVVYETYLQRCCFAVLVTFVGPTAVECKCKAVLLRCVGCSIGRGRILACSGVVPRWQQRGRGGLRG